MFGNDAALRAGWVTAGPNISASNYDAEQYNNYFKYVFGRIAEFLLIISILNVSNTTFHNSFGTLLIDSSQKWYTILPVVLICNFL